MKIFRTAAIIVLVSMYTSSAPASIIEFKSLDIDFTDSTDAAVNAIWSEPDILTITSNGLGWDGEPASLRDGWIHTAPLALGLSWRPPFAISIRVSIQPEIEEIVLGNGQTSLPYQGDIYVRYSPDAMNWSTWQALGQDKPQSNTAIQDPGRDFIGTVRVPYSEREEYQKLLQEYAELDVPWRSDEDAAVRWILASYPNFFETHLPFIGYIEFLYEGSFHGGQRITSFRAEITYGMSGLHYSPEDDSIYADRDSRPWSFTSENK
jgi:hypothetical protein